MVYHLHLLFNGEMKNPPKEPEFLVNWFYKLLQLIEMKVAIPPRAKYVTDPGNTGLTGVVGLETSHASFHVWDETNPGAIRFDLYTCGELNSKKVIDYVKETLDPVTYEYLIVNRENGFKIQEIGNQDE